MTKATATIETMSRAEMVRIILILEESNRKLNATVDMLQEQILHLSSSQTNAMPLKEAVILPFVAKRVAET